jgi:hypothetical protein
MNKMGALLSLFGFSTEKETTLEEARIILSTGGTITDPTIIDALNEEEAAADEETKINLDTINTKLDETTADARKQKYFKTASLAFSFYSNYPFGSLDESENWSSSMESFLNKMFENAEESVEIFWLLCQFPQFLPLIWPTGEGDDSYQDYSSYIDSAKNTVNSEAYMTALKSKIGAYVNGTLKNLIKKLYKGNCYQYLVREETSKVVEYDKIVSTKIDTISELTDEDTFIKELNKALLVEGESLFYKLAPGRAQKGICKNTVRLLPQYYPKRSPEYEMGEALIFLTNTLISYYGVYDTSTKKNAKCFNIDKHMEKAYKAAYSTSLTKWDCSTMVTAESLLLSVDSVTDGDWLSTLTVETTIEDASTYSAILVEDKPNKTPLNPTKWITNQFINDGLTSAILTDFRMPALSADVNDTFKKSFISSILKALQTETYTDFNLLKLPNKTIFSSIDYLTLNPPNDSILQSDKNVSVIAQFVYKCLVEYSCQWSLVFPIINNMTKGYMRGSFNTATGMSLTNLYTITPMAISSDAGMPSLLFPKETPPVSDVVATTV